MSEAIEVKLVSENRDKIRMRYRCPLRNRRITECTGETDWDKATAVKVRRQEELNRDVYATNGRMSWGVFCDRYLNALAANRETAAGTLEKASSSLKAVTAAINPSKVSDLTPTRLTYCRDAMASLRAPSTVNTAMAYLRTALNRAVEWGVLPETPRFPKPLETGDDEMHGRPLTDAEFELLLDTAAEVLTPGQLPSWQFLLTGLWLSGLRLSDACNLYWDGLRGHLVEELEGELVIRIVAKKEKGRKNRILPLTPDFQDFLRMVPASERMGRVFQPQPVRPGACKAGVPSQKRIGRVISKIGERSGIVSLADVETGEVKKYATAHDLRRSFGSRWAPLVQPTLLQELMRHATIATTMKYYVTSDAVRTSLLVRAAFDRADSDGLAPKLAPGLGVADAAP